MSGKAQFECSADVEQHFALLAELARSPQPPDDLWEQMDRVQRAASRKSMFVPPVPQPPASVSFEAVSPVRERKAYPLKSVERVALIPEQTSKRPKALAVAPAPRSIKSISRHSPRKHNGRER
jgi:hypothetical protein